MQPKSEDGILGCSVSKNGLETHVFYESFWCVVSWPIAGTQNSPKQVCKCLVMLRMASILMKAERCGVVIGVVNLTILRTSRF